MGKRFLIDTNVLIDAQAKKIPEQGLSFLAGFINDDFTISFITYIEFLGYNELSKASKDFIDLASIVGINKRVMNVCISLRKAQRIKLPDAIIAATALTYDYTLVTNNEKDFIGVDGLVVLNPYHF